VRWQARWVALVLMVAGAGACSRTPSVSDTPLLPVALPDLSRSDASVRTQGDEQYAALLRVVNAAGTSSFERGEAYGAFGMFLHAAEYLDAAEPAYRNAQRLVPGDVRWPYYLGHLYIGRGDTARAIASFERVVALRPDELPALVRLGRLHHDQGRTDDAERYFARAHTVDPSSVAVLAALGQVALARDDYATASAHLERALAIDPQALALHSPLAMAYRGLGDLARAEDHLARWRNREIPLPDPLRERLDVVLESGLSFELRGARALESGDWATAADLFRQGAAITSGTTPLGRSLRHKLGTALVLGGEVRAAVEQFEEVVRLAPQDGSDESAARAHYSLGVLMASAGRGARAIDHLTAAVGYNPAYAEAHVALADALRRAGRVEASLAHYREAVALSPRDAAYARTGYGIALARLGRYRDAREWFEETARLHPGSPDVINGLARLLAAAPEAAVRDERRALTLAGELARSQRTLELGETLAMARAAVGEYGLAASIQREVVEAALQAGLSGWASAMTENLHRYERGERARLPWHPDHPAHAPGPPVDPAIRAALE
jgi:tetratricopeptide (TPR) repeat protein